MRNLGLHYGSMIYPPQRQRFSLSYSLLDPSTKNSVQHMEKTQRISQHFHHAMCQLCKCMPTELTDQLTGIVTLGHFTFELQMTHL